MTPIQARFYIANDSRARDGAGKVVQQSFSLQPLNPAGGPVQLHGQLQVVLNGSAPLLDGEVYLVTIEKAAVEPAQPDSEI